MREVESKYAKLPHLKLIMLFLRFACCVVSSPSQCTGKHANANSAALYSLYTNCALLVSCKLLYYYVPAFSSAMHRLMQLQWKLHLISSNSKTFESHPFQLTFALGCSLFCCDYSRMITNIVVWNLRMLFWSRSCYLIQALFLCCFLLSDLIVVFRKSGSSFTYYASKIATSWNVCWGNVDLLIRKFSSSCFMRMIIENMPDR